MKLMITSRNQELIFSNETRPSAARGRPRRPADLDADEDFAAVVCWRLLGLSCAAVDASADLQGQLPNFPWREFQGLRKTLIHAARSPGLDVVLTRDLPALTQELERAISAAKAGSDNIQTAPADRR